MNLSDRQIVDGLINNDAEIVQSFFFDDCSRIFDYIIMSVFDYKVDKDELINELYLYLADNDWYKVKLFDYRSKLTTWLCVVAIRFFQKKRHFLIDNESTDTLLLRFKQEVYPMISVETRLDLETALKKMSNPIYANSIRELDILDKKPKDVADSMGVSLANLYNIHHRARVQLASLLEREGYYD